MGRNRVTRVLTTVAIVGVLLSSFPAAPATGRSVRRYGRIGSGVVHKIIRNRKIPRVIHVVIADVAGPSALKVSLSNGSLPGLERTSSMARRNNAIAAINGDFFRPSGRPVAAFAKSGELVQTPLVWGANLAFGNGGRRTFMGHPNVSVKLVTASSGNSVRLARVNEGRPRRSQVKLYTKSGGRLVRPPRNACSARLRRRGSNRFVSSTAQIVAPFKVKAIRCRRARMKLRGGVVVAARRRGQGKAFIRSLRNHRRQRLAWSLGWPNVAETIGGNPVLVKDGELAYNNLRGSHSIFNVHPRTGVGIRGDGKILLVTVDGRRPRYSRGMTLMGFARLMKSLGARWALNLDGGGSTTMVVKGRVMNRPSDGRERPVGSALMIVGSRSSVRTSSISAEEAGVAATDVMPSESAGIGAFGTTTEFSEWSLAQQDPASIGGLASWLATEDEPLPPDLADVARDFDRSRVDDFVEAHPGFIADRDEPN
ncbi:MAG: phosphodiester glycosidase family protein [Actinomycetota bacterium]